MPDLSLNSLERSASRRGDGGEKRMAIRRRQAMSDEKVITDPAPFSGLRRHTRLCQPD
jgi:hypothetical protein